MPKFPTHTLITVLCFCVLNICAASYSNSTSKNVRNVNNPFETRQSRLITFNTFDDGITLELDFHVPFITIPVKQSLAMATGSIANINLGALVLSGGIVAGLTLLAPIIPKLFTKHQTINQAGSWKKNGKLDEQSEDYWKFEEFLKKNNIDLGWCLSELVCKSKLKVENGNGESFDKIIDGIFSSKWAEEQFEFDARKCGLTTGNKCEIANFVDILQNLL